MSTPVMGNSLQTTEILDITPVDKDRNAELNAYRDAGEQELRDLYTKIESLERTPVRRGAESETAAALQDLYAERDELAYRLAKLDARLAGDRPAVVKYVLDVDGDMDAGQYYNLTLLDPTGEPIMDDNGRPLTRSYSVARDYDDTTEFCIRLKEDGALTPELWELDEGASLGVEGPVGHFTLQEDTENDIAMVVTGTGIAPIQAMVDELYDVVVDDDGNITDIDPQRDVNVHVIHGVAWEDEAAYRDTLETLDAAVPSFSYDLALSQEPYWDETLGDPERVQQIVTERVVAGDLDLDNLDVYACGSMNMIRDLNELLVSEGMQGDTLPNDRFFFEPFNR